MVWLRDPSKVAAWSRGVWGAKPPSFAGRPGNGTVAPPGKQGQAPNGRVWAGGSPPHGKVTPPKGRPRSNPKKPDWSA